jgi:hypothetical protein
MKKKLLVMITIISVMSWILIPGVFADSTNRGNANKDQTQVVDQDEVEDETTDGSKGKADAQQKKEAKDKLVAEKAVLETEKDALESQKDALELEYEAAKESGNTELAEQLATQLESLKSEFEAKKQLMKDKQEEIKATIRATYTSGTTEIVLNLESNTAYVNGAEVTIDVAPTTINSRTIVPLRFITETLGLKVDWDDETDTIEIGDDTEETTTETPATDATTETPATDATTETPATDATTETPTTDTTTTDTTTTDTTSNHQ